MEIRHLRYLIAVADELSFVAAANRLAIAQPALSRQIRDLESEIGTELFVRDATGTRLTPAGEVCVVTARRIVDDLSLSLRRAREAEHGLVGRCILGAGRYPLWNGLLGRLISHVQEEYPGIDVIVDERALRGQWDALARAELDIAFGTAPPAEYLQFVVETHSLDLVDAIAVSKAHPLASRESVKLDDLASETWIRHAPSAADEPTRVFQSVLTSRGFVPRATRHAANDDALRMLVRAGAGWSALPHSLRAMLPRNLVAIPLEDLAVPFRYVHFHRRGDNRPVVRSVLGALRRAARKEGFAALAEPDSGIRTIPSTPVVTGAASRLELRHLRYFVATIEHETIGRAAEALEITQPALSRQLRDLEEEVGASLLHRGARGVQPTTAGQSLYSDAVRILRAADQLSHEAHRAVRGTAGRCVVGVAPTPLIWDVITHAVATCGSDFPDVEVTVEDVPTPRQITAIGAGVIDLAIGHQYPSLADLNHNVRRIPLLPDSLNQAFVSTEHPLAKHSKVPLKALADLPFLFMQRHFSPNLYDLVMSTFVRAGFAPRIEGEYDGLPTVWALSAQGLGWCLASQSQRDYPPNGLVAVELEDFALPWGCELTFRADEARPAVLETLRAIELAAQAIADASMRSQETKYWPQVALTG